MKEIKLNFERELNFRRLEEISKGKLLIKNIIEEEGRWTCYWSLDFLCHRGKTFGEDSLSSLTNALIVLEGLIAEAEADGLRIWWQYENDKGGIPFYPPHSSSSNQ